MATSSDLVLRPNCVRCGAAGDLFAASCRHMTLCIACGRAMAEADAPCTDCGTPVKKLLKEYKVRKSAAAHKQYFVGRFPGGLPPLSDKSGLRWSMRKDIPRPSDPAREKFKIAPDRLKNKPWILEDDTGSHQYQGQLEGGQQAIYYVLTKHGKEFMATPVNSWFNFHKAVQYKQLTLEEAEEHMKNRRKTADGYRWMMRATNGAADAGNSRKGNGGDEEADGKKDKKKPAVKADDEDEDLVKPEDFDEEEAVERGDDWEHEETFTDDDEAVGNDPEEREDQGPDVPAPPEMKQEEDEMEAEEGQNQEAGGLSQSGRDMKKLLGKSGGLDESDGGDEDEEDEDVDLDDDLSSPVLAPQNAKVEPAEAVKPAQTTARPTAASAQKKRKAEDTKAAGPSSNKKNRSNEVKREAPATTAAAAPSGATTKPAQAAAPAAAAAAGPVTEEELKALLKRTGPQKSQDLVSRFRSRLKTPDEKAAFAAALKKISKIQKKEDGAYIVLK